MGWRSGIGLKISFTAFIRQVGTIQSSEYQTDMQRFDIGKT